MMDRKICSVRFNLQSDLLCDPYIKQIGKLDLFEIRSVFHCDGSVLCLIHDYSRLVVWNPYLDQTRLIQSNFIPLKNVLYKNNYGLGYDSSRSYKILRVFVEYLENAKQPSFEHEIYDFDSDSWRVLGVTPGWCIDIRYSFGVPLKGNTEGGEEEEFLLCFDFIRERFGPRLKLPLFQENMQEPGALSCVREEQLAILFKHEFSHKMELWLTTKVEPEFVSWSKFLVFDMFPGRFMRAIPHGRYFIDEKKKVACLFDCAFHKDEMHNIAYMVGEDGYYMEVDLGESSKAIPPIVCSYVPSLVQIEERA